MTDMSLRAAKPAVAEEPRLTRGLNAAVVSLLLYGMLILISIFMILPFIWMLSTSFKPQTEIFTRPPILISPNMSLEGYDYIYNYEQTGGVLNVLKNTIFVSGTFTIFSLFFCALGGYGFAKYRFPGRKYLVAFLLATMIVP